MWNEMIQVIVPANPLVVRTLGPVKEKSGAQMRRFTYSIRLETEDVVLYYHVLTREMIAVPSVEEQSSETLQYLREHRFLVPAEKDDYLLVKQVRSAFELLAHRPLDPKSFVILTTTDCNARCYYCFEKGCRRENMNLETADRVAEYIEKHCCGERAVLSWFGGEPLYNKAAIDRICTRLADDGQEYVSLMITNGFLFDEETVEHAISLWKLRRVQITLDGTEDVYNRTKNYIYPGVNAFRVVWENIDRLLTAGIQVHLRMNLSVYNAGDLLTLTDQLLDAFGGREGFTAYVSPLLEEFPGGAKQEEEKRRFISEYAQINEVLSTHGLVKPERLKWALPLNQCMADSGGSVVILPNGELTLCEQIPASDIVGRIDSDIMNQSVIDRWRERYPETETCRRCMKFPECVLIRLCPNGKPCKLRNTEALKRNMENAVLYEYRLWKGKDRTKRDETIEFVEGERC